MPPISPRCIGAPGASTAARSGELGGPPLVLGRGGLVADGAVKVGPLLPVVRAVGLEVQALAHEAAGQLVAVRAQRALEQRPVQDVALGVAAAELVEVMADRVEQVRDLGVAAARER